MSIIPESQSVMIDRYTEIFVKHATSMRPGQVVYIRGQEALHDFGLRVGQAAYEHGARSWKTISGVLSCDMEGG